MKYLPIGTISHGTLRPEHLIPAFIDALESVELDAHERYRLGQIKHDMELPDFYDSEDAEWVLNEVLFDLLDNHCRTGEHFGAHEGDGSDFGVWPNDDDEEE